MDEYTINKWILENSDSIKENIKHLYRPHHLFPSTLQDIYIHQFENEVIRIIQQLVIEQFKINQDEALDSVSVESLRTICPSLLTI